MFPRYLKVSMDDSDIPIIDLAELAEQPVGRTVLLRCKDYFNYEPPDVTQLRIKNDSGSPRYHTIPLLIRKNLINMLSKLIQIKQAGVNSNNNWEIFHKCIFSGGSGVGKSLLLYLLACWCKHNGWKVFYIESISYSSSLSFKSKLSICLNESNYGPLCDSKREIDYWRVFEKEIIHYSTKRDTPFLLAIDQWNAVHSVNPNDNPLADYLRNFSDHTMAYGATLYAISSSFNIAPYFKNGDYLIKEYMNNIPKYSLEEFDIIKQMYSSMKLWPVKDGLSEEEIVRWTGRLPRLIRFIIDYCIRADQHESNWSKIEIEKSILTQLGVRVTSILRKQYSTPELTTIDDIRLKNNLFALKLLKEEDLYEQDLPDLWRLSGLIEAVPTAGIILSPGAVGRTKYQPSCSLVRRAIYQQLSSNIDEVITVIASESTIRWRALELMILKELRNCSIILTGNLIWERQIDKEPIIQETPVNGVYKHIELQDQDFVICHKGFPVIDYVFLCDGNLYFIQVSQSSYSKHKSKMGDLFVRKCDYDRKPGSIRGGKVSIYYMFCQMAGIKGVHVGDNSIREAIPAYYVYITTSDKSNIREKHTIHLGPAELARLFPNSWMLVSKYFDKPS